LRELWPSDRPLPSLRVRVWHHPWASGSAVAATSRINVSLPANASSGLIRVVVAHEVAHLLAWEPNDLHGAAFWARLAEVLELGGVLVPDLRELPRSQRARDRFFKNALTTLTS